MATKSIGYVADLIGDAQVRSVDGVVRILSIGDQINDGDILTTGLNTQIVLEFYNGQRFQVGENTKMLLDESVFASLNTYPDDRVDQLAELQSLIVEGIDLAELEATAAGAAASGADGLHQASVYTRDGEQGIVETRVTPFNVSAPGPENHLAPDDDSAFNSENSSTTNDASSNSEISNRPPVAIDDAITATEDTPFNSVIDLDANDTDLDGDAFTVVAGTFATTQGGSIAIAADGSYTYTPALNFNGTDSVDYTVTDGSLTDVGTLHITVTAANDAPEAIDDAIIAIEDTPFSSAIDLDSNDTDLDGDALSVVAGTFGTAQGGSITMAVDGSYTYTPALNFNGSDSVDYTVTDGSLTDVGTLNITVNPVNDAPIAVDDAVTAIENTLYSSTVDLDSNDMDLDGDALTVAAGTFATAQGGSITIAADGSYTYTPAVNFNGVDSVDYTVTDGSLTDVGTLSINVSVVNNAPDAIDDAGALDGLEDSTTGSLNATMLANDSDLDGDTISITEINGTALTGTVQSIGVTNGTVNIDAAGNITFRANANYNGPVSFNYTLSDGSLSR
jgi:hypothetical protein